MTDLATAGKAKAAGFARRERREVVVQHVAALKRRQQTVDDLLVGLRAKRYGGERLRLTAREQSRTVRTRQNAGLDGDRADLRRRATIKALAVCKDHLTHFTRFDALHGATYDLLDLEFCIGFVRGDHSGGGFEGCQLDLLAECTAFFLRRACADRCTDTIGDRGFDGSDDVGRRLDRRDRTLGRCTDEFGKLTLHSVHLADPVMGELHRGDEVCLGDLVRCPFHHHDGRVGTGNQNLEVRRPGLLEGRVDDEFTIYAANAHGRDRTAERDVADRECSRSAERCQHIRLVLHVIRIHRCDDLRFAAPFLGEERTQWTVDQT